MEQYPHERSSNQKQNVNYRELRTMKYNPITGEPKKQQFGFEDFSLKANKGYRAHNVIVSSHFL